MDVSQDMNYIECDGIKEYFARVRHDAADGALLRMLNQGMERLRILEGAVREQRRTILEQQRMIGELQVRIHIDELPSLTGLDTPERP